MSRHRHMHHTKEGIGLVLTIPTPTHSAVFSGGLRPCQQLLHCDPRTPGLTCENVVYTQLHLLFHKGSCAWILLDQSRPHDARPVSGHWGVAICRLAHTEELEPPNPGVESAPPPKPWALGGSHHYIKFSDLCQEAQVTAIHLRSLSTSVSQSDFDPLKSGFLPPPPELLYQKFFQEAQKMLLFQTHTTPFPS